MSPIKIKIFSNFCDSQDCKSAFERSCQTHLLSHYGNDKIINITIDEDYTHAIILNTAMPKLKSIPKKNVIGFACEPVPFLGLTHEFIEYAKQNIGKYFIGDLYNLPSPPFTERYAYLWHMTPLTYIPPKIKLMSIMISQKTLAPGHQYRHILVQNILKENLPIDIYGRGTKYYPKDSRICGEFTETEPYEDYQFHLCIENFQTNHYFSEKISNTLLCGTTPVYLGCKHIDEYFTDYIIHLSGDPKQDIDLIKCIISSPDKYKKVIDIGKVKDKLNWIKNIETIFEN
jgi:hypothetical protein